MIGGIFSQRAARNAQIAQQNYNMMLAAYNREQAEYHARIIRLSRLGPVKYKCGPWRWKVVPIPGTVLRHVEQPR